MKKLLYVTFENFENNASGVAKKIRGHLKAFGDAGIACELLAVYGKNVALFSGVGAPDVLPVRLSARIALCAWAAEHAKAYDIAYIRFQFFCPFVLRMVKAFHDAGAKVIMEIPTYPYVPELKRQGSRGVHKRMIDAAFRKTCARYIDRFASPLHSEPILGKPCIEIRNGIDVDAVRSRKVRKDDGKIHLLAVAMMAPWQGYDRVIEGLNRYYQGNGQDDIVLHLVGEGVALQTYAGLTARYGLKNHVVQHGQLFGEALETAYDLADIGIGSVGSFRRTAVKRTNALKIMEYMAKGLPIICEPGEVGISMDSDYRLTVPADESPIDIDRVIRFYRDVYAGRSAEEVIKTIRAECRENCSVKAGLKGILEYIECGR